MNATQPRSDPDEPTYFVDGDGIWVHYEGDDPHCIGAKGDGTDELWRLALARMSALAARSGPRDA